MISLYENGLNGILADEMGLGKVSARHNYRLHLDLANDIVLGSPAVKRYLGTLLDCVPFVSPEQLDHGV